MPHSGIAILSGLVLVAALGGCSSQPPVPRPRSAVTTPAQQQHPLATQAEFVWDRIGTSTQGRPIEATTIGSTGPRVLLIGGIHGDEPEGGLTVNAIAAYLRALQPRATVRIVRDANPDGTAARTRRSASGVDLNRNWPAKNFRPGTTRGPAPLSEPETRALHTEFQRFAPDLVLVAHASRRGPFVNYDGPAAATAAAFARAAAATDPRWRVVQDMGYPTPGSLGSYVGIDLGIPILTLEFARGHDPGAAWDAMREGTRAVLEGVPLAR